MAETSGARRLLVGAERYLGSVLAGVLFAPVLPDIAVDLFGGGSWDWALRLAALFVVVAACVGVYWLQLTVAARRARRGGSILEGIERRDVLILPVGFGTEYRTSSERTGPPSVAEWLVDSCRPTTVITVATPQTLDRAVGVGQQLTAAGIAVDPVTLRDGLDPAVATADAERLVVGHVRASGWTGRTFYVDTTGGTVPMSIAMLRVAALLGMEATYVSSEFDADRRPVPGTQRGRAFDVAGLFGPTGT